MSKKNTDWTTAPLSSFEQQDRPEIKAGRRWKAFGKRLGWALHGWTGDESASFFISKPPADIDNLAVAASTALTSSDIFNVSRTVCDSIEAALKAAAPDAVK